MRWNASIVSPQLLKIPERTIFIKREKGKKKKPSSPKKWKRSEVSEFLEFFNLIVASVASVFHKSSSTDINRTSSEPIQATVKVERHTVRNHCMWVDTTHHHETPAVVHQRRETPVHPLHAYLDEARPLRHGEFTTYTHSVFSLKRQHDFDITINNRPVAASYPLHFMRRSSNRNTMDMV